MWNFDLKQHKVSFEFVLNISFVVDLFCQNIAGSITIYGRMISPTETFNELKNPVY